MRTGAIRTIRLGPERGMRYRVFPDYGISPVYGGWEPDLQRALVTYLTSGSVAYDVGANYGIHTLLMARLVGESGHVYAFEPLDSVRHWLLDNIALNGLQNVTCVPIALSASTGTKAFTTGHHAGAGHLVMGDATPDVGTTLVVETATLDDLILERGFRTPNLIKMGVEGAESDVLLGARKILDSARPILIVELHNPEQDAKVGEIIRDLGYQAWRIDSGEVVRDLGKGWPHKDGLWGLVVAHP
jgi:FkbM family methyltransferase